MFTKGVAGRGPWRGASCVCRGLRIVFFFGILAIHGVPGILNAQANRDQRNTPSPTPSGRIAHATRVDRAPLLDGTLNDSLWKTAEPIDDFLQREPYEAQKSTEKTEVRILYTRHEVYIGIFCRDSEPKKIVATELRRDLPQSLDDNFEILIDSTHDRRNAYVFQINPLGTQSDGLITEERHAEEQDYDPGWDGVWTSAAQINEQGWTATVAIPFTTLNFTQSENQALMAQ